MSRINRMDKGQGLVDRFLVAVPLALCPTSAEVETAMAYLSTEPDDAIKQTFQYISDCQQNQTTLYTFDEDAKQLLKSLKDTFIAEVNEPIQDGSFLPPKSKQLDLRCYLSGISSMCPSFCLRINKERV